MPDINLQPSDTNVASFLYVTTAMDQATIVSDSATTIVMTGGGFSFTLSGTGFTTTIIGGVAYIDSGTVDTIDATFSGASYQMAQANLDGATLRDALVADVEGPDQAALENLILQMTYVVYGTSNADFHIDGTETSADGQPLTMIGFVDYHLGAGHDIIEDAGTNDDLIFGGDGNDTLHGNGGNDKIYGENNDDTLFGEAGADTLEGGGGIDGLDGGSDDDVFLIAAQAEFDGDTIEGGTETDTIRFTAVTAGQSLALTGQVTGVEIVEIADAAGDRGGTTALDLDAADVNNGLTIRGNAGDNVITGTEQADVIEAGGGADTVNAGDGDDTIRTTGNGENDTSNGGEGNDTFVFSNSFFSGNIHGDAGIADHVDASAYVGFALIVDLAAGTYDDSGASRAMTGIEHVTGGTGADQFVGNAANNRLVGNGGNDTLNGAAGHDTLNGGALRDTLIGGLGNDTYHADVFNEVITETNASLAVGGNDVVFYSGAGTFTLSANVERLTLTHVTANVKGNGNTLVNTLTGNARMNTLDGKAGNDVLKGLGGNDILIGGAGRDTLTGGPGSDTLRFLSKTHSPNNGSRDTITDFDKGGTGDRIDVSKLFGPAMAYIHNAAFSAAGQVRINDIAGADIIVEVNTGGSLAADFSVRLKNTTLASMNQGDFVL